MLRSAPYIIYSVSYAYFSITLMIIERMYSSNLNLNYFPFCYDAYNRM